MENFKVAVVICWPSANCLTSAWIQLKIDWGFPHVVLKIEFDQWNIPKVGRELLGRSGYRLAWCQQSDISLDTAKNRLGIFPHGSKNRI
jgi:hypothetical protein